MKEIGIKTLDLTRYYFPKSTVSRMFSFGRYKKNDTKIIKALQQVNIEVRYGEIVGILGPNGAGKTTLLKTLSTLILPTEGTALINGYDIVKESDKVKMSIGYAGSSERSFYYRLTGWENLMFFATLYNIPHQTARKRVNYLAEFLELQRIIMNQFMNYSSGEKKKLDIARSLLVDQSVLIYDEPTSTLDPNAARIVREKMKKMANQGKAILLATHNMVEAETLCDKVIILHEGRIVKEGIPLNLKQAVNQKRGYAIEGVIITKRKNQFLKVIAQVRISKINYESYKDKHLWIRIIVPSIEEVRIILSLVHDKKILFDIRRLQSSEPTLEEAFAIFTNGESR